MYVHFFTCIKKRTKESAADHLAFGFPALLEMIGSLKTRTPFGVLRQFKLLFGHFCGARLRDMAIKPMQVLSVFGQTGNRCHVSYDDNEMNNYLLRKAIQMKMTPSGSSHKLPFKGYNKLECC